MLVGLGNPGALYARQRHNVGFMALERIAGRYGGGASWRTRKFDATTIELDLGGKNVLGVKPLTFMNESGRAVAALARYHQVPNDEIMVIHDELDLAPGKVKIKRGGGAAGHNGLRSLDQHMRDDYFRLRIGIGHPGHKSLVTNYVLGKFSEAEEKWLDILLDAVTANAPLLLGPRRDDIPAAIARLMAPILAPATQPAKSAAVK